jgi:hypothetical protein
MSKINWLDISVGSEELYSFEKNEEREVVALLQFLYFSYKSGGKEPNEASQIIHCYLSLNMK